VAAAPLVFPSPAPSAPLGAWALVGPGELIASARCTSPFPDGQIRFVEDHARPPSRAYLKLWEAFTLAGRYPRPGDRCVDLGSSPGGWTWALERLCARVVSVDKAPIDERLMRLTRVRYVKDSAFAVDPTKMGRVDWLVSDVICYPARTVKLVCRWLAVHPGASFVVTVKLQGVTDTTPLRDLEAIGDARLVHLSHNKHELTWIRLAPVEPE
jgi:23S rRNA (cytidine2498-2'-O)-methyltransferase